MSLPQCQRLLVVLSALRTHLELRYLSPNNLFLTASHRVTSSCHAQGNEVVELTVTAS